MEIIWHGYACFELISGGYSLLLDPFRGGTLAGFPELRFEADEALCSHGHDGHGALSAVRLRGRGLPSPFEVEDMPTYHDVLRGRLRGENTARIIRAEGLRLVHLGDLGCGLTRAQEEKISGCDALMLPVGGILTIEPYAAYELVRRTGPGLVLPMHYNVGGGSRRLRPLEEFISLFSPEEAEYLPTNRLTLDKSTRPAALVAVLRPPWRGK